MDAIFVLFWFPRPSVILSCIIPKEPEAVAPQAQDCHIVDGFLHI